LPADIVLWFRVEATKNSYGFQMDTGWATTRWARRAVETVSFSLNRSQGIVDSGWWKTKDQLADAYACELSGNAWNVERKPRAFSDFQWTAHTYIFQYGLFYVIDVKVHPELTKSDPHLNVSKTMYLAFKTPKPYKSPSFQPKAARIPARS